MRVGVNITTCIICGKKIHWWQKSWMDGDGYKIVYWHHRCNTELVRMKRSQRWQYIIDHLRQQPEPEE